MILRKYLVFISLFLFAAIAGANPSSTETILTGQNQLSEQVFLIKYFEEGQWTVREIVQHIDGWQDIISETTYKSSTEAEADQLHKATFYTNVKPLPEFELQSMPEIQLSGQSIWPNTQVWNQSWEIKYAEWLTKEVDTQFFSKYKVATDCADVAYAARWIFARINGLPAAHRLNGKVLFTNQSLRSEWQNLPSAKNWFEDRKFLASLNYLLNMTYTHTLMRDSYPVKITPEVFLPGIHYLNLNESSGHTQLVHRVNLAKDALPFLILQSTVPRKVRDLNESLFWAYEAPVAGKSGFHKILWPLVSGSKYSLIPAQNMLSYSLHQYAVDFIRSKDVSFGQEVLLRLQPDLDLLLILKSGLNDLRSSLALRAQVVEDGYLACGQKSCPENSQGYEDWSTPFRDSQIMSLLGQLRALILIAGTADLRKEMTDFFEQEKKQTYLIFDGVSYTLQQISAAWDLILFSSNPNDEPGLRWGLEPQFVSLKIKKSLKEGLENRKRKMSFVEDQKLQKNQHIVAGYCKHFEAASCQKLKDELITVLEISGETKTVNEWLAKTFWLNADPKQSVANQWGALQKTSPFQNLEGLKEFQVSKNGIGAAKDSKGFLRIGPMTVQGLINVDLPTGFIWQIFDRKLSVAYATSKDQILRYDFLKKSSDIFPLLLEDGEQVFLPMSDEIIIFSQKKIWRLSFKNKSFQMTWKGSFKAIKPASQEFLFIVEDLSGWKYLDLRNQQPVITPMFDLAFNDTAIRLLIFENEKNYVFSENSNPGDYLIVHKTSGIFSEFKAPGQIMGWSQGMTRAIGLSSNISDGVFILTLDDKFKIIQSEKIGSFIQAINGRFRIMNEDFSSSHFFEFQGEKLISLELLKDEERILTIGEDNWFATGLKNNQMRLRSLDGHKIYYEGSYLSPLGTTFLPEWGVSWQPEGLMVINFKNPKGPAALIFAMNGHPSEFSSEVILTKVDRGFVYSNGIFNYWVDLQAF